jgi:hypothetical protein
LISKLKKLEKDQKVHYFLNEESIQENEGWRLCHLNAPQDKRVFHTIHNINTISGLSAKKSLMNSPLFSFLKLRNHFYQSKFVCFWTDFLIDFLPDWFDFQVFTWSSNHWLTSEFSWLSIRRNQVTKTKNKQTIIKQTKPSFTQLFAKQGFVVIT